MYLSQLPVLYFSYLWFERLHRHIMLTWESVQLQCLWMVADVSSPCLPNMVLPSQLFHVWLHAMIVHQEVVFAVAGTSSFMNLFSRCSAMIVYVRCATIVHTKLLSCAYLMYRYCTIHTPNQLLLCSNNIFQSHFSLAYLFFCQHKCCHPCPAVVQWNRLSDREWMETPSSCLAQVENCPSSSQQSVPACRTRS